ncbi:MAG: biotin/lipoyl-binding protein [Bacteroidales bacterium]|nr:biotin/lipoyl-binding protein [Bacteroidales bacterium]
MKHLKVDIKIGDKVSQVELIEQNGNSITISIDGEILEADVQNITPNIYSFLHDNKSIDVEVQDGNKNKDYIVNTMMRVFETTVIDAEAKYQMARGKGGGTDDENAISSPMPGKVVKILVKEGDEVKSGETVVIISAMKMESEYKVKQDRKIIEVCVKEGDNIIGGQPLIIVE